MKRYARSSELWEKANSYLLNGIQTFSKSPVHIAPGACPIFVERGEGAYFWDSDGHRYLDFVMGLGPVVLGYANKEVDSAVCAQMERGLLFSLSSPLELELAELLVEIIPSAEKLRFLKTGSEAVTAAVRIARAYTKREKILCCGHHGWHDWTIGRGTRNAGVPAGVCDLVAEFQYNDLESLKYLFEKTPGQVAAVVLEPVGFDPPENGFLEGVRELSSKYGALLIFDEIITGFRLSLGGAQSYFSIEPDLSVFGKAIANGYPLSALVGRKEILDSVSENVYISSTFAGDLLSITAALKNISIIQRENTIGHLKVLGEALRDGLNQAFEKNSIDAICKGMFHKTITVFKDMEEIPGKAIETVFRKLCLERGVFLGYGHFICQAHTMDDIEHALSVASESLEIIDQAIRARDLLNLLEGEPAKDVVKRF